MFPHILCMLLLFFSLCGYSTEIYGQSENPEDLVRSVLIGSPEAREDALAQLADRGEKDVIASLILIVRFRGNDPAVLDVISKLAGVRLNDWFEAMVWQQDHPEVTPHTSYRPLKVMLYSQIDLRFLRFIGDERAKAENLDIRLEEITWGGVRVDGIPALDNPATIPADSAEYLLDDDLVYGVVINEKARAYPLRILGWHEMANDVVGGVPVSLTYCTLCGTGILYETMVKERKEPFSFGSSGLLYRSNKLMYDRQTDSLWNQFTGRPVSGRLLGSGLELKVRPMVITSWADWKKQYPDTTVLSLETGHNRDYSSGKAYKKYFDSPELMFPVQVSELGGLKPKDLVFGISQPGAAKAWPLTAFTKNPVINDRLGRQSLVLIGDPTTRTVRAYARGKEQFRLADDPMHLTTESGLWRISEEFLTGPGGEKLPRLPGRLSYWFAWNSFMGIASELYTEP